MAANLGRLAVISTPIGNLGDLSPRARDELAAAELVAAEDTRRTGQLLTTLGLSRPLVSLHEHNERERIDELLEKLRGGARIALVSDAGTPLLSDPGIRAGASRRAGRHERGRGAGPFGDHRGAAASPACPPSGLRSKDFCPRGSASAARASPSWRPKRARWCSSRRRIASPKSLEDMAAGFGGDAPRGGGARAHQGFRNRVSRHARRRSARRRAAMRTSRAARSRWWSRARRAPADDAAPRAQLDATLTVLARASSRRARRRRWPRG